MENINQLIHKNIYNDIFQPSNTSLDMSYSNTTCFFVLTKTYFPVKTLTSDNFNPKDNIKHF